MKKLAESSHEAVGDFDGLRDALAALPRKQYRIAELPDGFAVCGKARMLMETLKEKRVVIDSVITDPPWMAPAAAYPQDAKSGKKDGSGRSWADTITMEDAFFSIFDAAYHITPPKGASVFFCGSAVSVAVMTQLVYPLWKRCYILAWNKNRGRFIAPFKWLPEFMLYCDDGWRAGFDGENETMFDRVFEEKSVPNSQRVHPAEKPVRLLERLISLTTPPGGIVLDCYAGSFSLMRAARNVGRKFLCVEADVKLYQRAMDKAKREGVRAKLL